jgi:hypothetical protein
LTQPILRGGGFTVTDRGLRELKALKALQTLDLDGAKVTDAGVKDLVSALPKLEIRRR